ncbi:MAG: hypothetical protein HY911_11210 [Desulfobacterales bacterium]|nr:hypothetical protein [Desulfobacterales bacterium]MBI5897196.1 hypothetical protein [Desulfobacterales bacterium]
MKKTAFSISLFLILTVSLAKAYDLATEISNENGKVTLSSIGYAKAGLIKVETSAKGKISLKGTISVNGKANVVMWSKVEGNYYFSKLPALQNIQNQQNLSFEIPFNAADKTVTEVILEVELLGGGRIEVDRLKLVSG